jgi:hypothetical protein
VGSNSNEVSYYAVISGAFEKLLKAIISFVMLPARLSVYMTQLGSHQTDFHEV